MIFVSWSDQNNILIYRTFEDFKRFHVSIPQKTGFLSWGGGRSPAACRGCKKELKRKFPIEGGSLRRSDRTIPRFRDANVKQRKRGKLNRCLEILKLLETYSQELLKMDAKISQGEDVIQFFKAQTQDLDPSFPENSVVIMPSEIGGEKKNPAQQKLSSITHPQVSQSYRCIETFETKDTKNKTFKVDKKEIIEVLIKDMTGWWLVENADKQIAWFPASYLEEIDEGKSGSGSLYFVARAYESQKADELSLNNGVVVEVIRKSDDGWWLIRSLPEVEQARSSPLDHAAAMHSNKSPRLTHEDRNDSGFVESSTADLNYSLTDPDLAACAPKVPVRPSAHEILQKCSTITKRAVQQSSSRPALQALLPLPSTH
uniref:NADPH oxidase organizer 1 n=1 Tax=Athene cunicularia TaxID=194338 RepID=A0A663LMD2_ATHCN